MSTGTSRPFWPVTFESNASESMPGIRGSQEGCPKIRIGLGFAIGVGEAREVIYTEEVFDGWKSVTRLLRGDGLSVEGRKKSAEAGRRW
jgi:hypothetical protein